MKMHLQPRTNSPSKRASDVHRGTGNTDYTFSNLEYGHHGALHDPTFITGRSFMNITSAPRPISHAPKSSPIKTTRTLANKSTTIASLGSKSALCSNAGSILSLPPHGDEISFFKSAEQNSEYTQAVLDRFSIRSERRVITNSELENEDDVDGGDHGSGHTFVNDKDASERINAESAGNSGSETPIVLKASGAYLEDKAVSVQRLASPKEKRCVIIVVSLLFFCLVCATTLSSLPVFTCNNSKRICVPQMTIQLTDKSSAAKTALLTVREALKVLSYLAIDFGETDNDFINSSLDDYYQNKVIHAFSVNTIYQLNFLGYCRLSTKNLEYFCMRSYGFDLLSVFVRDAGVQLGELTKTNLTIMGDSFAIIYELAINGFNQLMNKENQTNEYLDWAILLQKFSKGLGFLSFAQFIFDCAMIGLLLSIVAACKCEWPGTSNRQKFIQFVKKWCIVSITLIGFLNVASSFLLSSLTLEYSLKLRELATNVGIANVTTGLGFGLTWLSFGFHVVGMVLVVLVANFYRKGIM